MMKGGGGSIVLCSSAVAFHGTPNHEAIAAAKGGVAALALSAASTYAPYNIRVNTVAPGLVRSLHSKPYQKTLIRKSTPGTVPFAEQSLEFNTRQRRNSELRISDYATAPQDHQNCGTGRRIKELMLLRVAAYSMKPMLLQCEMQA